MKLNTYQKEGYKIHATEKAYKLFYKKQGFVPIGSEVVSKKKISEMTVAELKKYLQEAGVAIPPKAGKKELLELTETLDQQVTSAQETDPTQQQADPAQGTDPAQQQADPAQGADSAQQQADPAQGTDPARQQADPAQGADPAQETDLGE